MATQYANVYEMDRAYGGAEEGGWWYDVGELVHTEALPLAEAAAKARIAELEAEYPNTGESSSVVYEGGDYRVFVEDEPGAPYFPATRPHYE